MTATVTATTTRIKRITVSLLSRVLIQAVSLKVLDPLCLLELLKRFEAIDTSDDDVANRRKMDVDVWKVAIQEAKELDKTIKLL